MEKKQTENFSIFRWREISPWVVQGGKFNFYDDDGDENQNSVYILREFCLSWQGNRRMWIRLERAFNSIYCRSGDVVAVQLETGDSPHKLPLKKVLHRSTLTSRESICTAGLSPKYNIWGI